MRLAGLLCAIVFTLVISCTTKEQKEEHLARQYCGTCHSFPEPALLNKDAWRTVMPQMAVRMGIDMTPLMRLSEQDYPYVVQTLPQNPMISGADFDAIMNYYERESPAELSLPPDFEAKEIDQFEVTELKVLNQRPTISMFRADTIDHKFWISNRESRLYTTDFAFKQIDSVQLTSPASSIDHSLIALMGIMDPNDQPKGSVITLDQKTIIDSLKRPVDIQVSDLNNDNVEDVVICEFGNYGGELAVYESKSVRHVIGSLPGARRTIVKDFNNDGLKDILVLFSQGDEQISLYTNAGSFRFRVTTLLRFPPVYGSSYFDITDFNKDGHWDIIYTNGDNADYSIIKKPYHGVRIFLNDGKNQFSESWFYPLYGSSMAIARDFDKDGDVDIAAISFFPDFINHPERGFVYFENNEGKLEPYVTPLAADARWLLMEAVDIDADGYTDIVLAALDFDTGIPQEINNKWRESPVDILLLKNKRKK